jgi:hypothetical protein
MHSATPELLQLLNSHPAGIRAPDFSARTRGKIKKALPESSELK